MYLVLHSNVSNFYEKITRHQRDDMHNGITGNCILQSLSPQGGALASLNPSNDSHERSRETGRKCGALGPLNVVARNRYPPRIRSNAQPLCPFITTSKIRGPFNECGGITYPTYPLRVSPIPQSGRMGQTIYKRFHILELCNIFAIKKGLI